MTSSRSSRRSAGVRGLLLLGLGLGLAAVAFYALLAPGPEDEIDDASREQLERVLRAHEDGP